MPDPRSRSPFPGMDPYLEEYWGDVHYRLCTYSCDLLRRNLPPGLIARIDERTIIEDDSVNEPTVEGVVQVRDTSHDGRVVTVIEFTSPANKKLKSGREERHEPLSESVNLVEIDLIRSGPWVLSVPEAKVPENLRRTYRICVARDRS